MMKLLLTLCLLLAVCNAYRNCGKFLTKYNRCMNVRLNGSFNELKTRIAKVGCLSGTVGTNLDWRKRKPNQPAFITVKYSKPLGCKKPVLTVGVTGTDTYRNKNTRMQTNIVSQSAAGFKLKVITWANSIVYNAWYSWMACCPGV